MKMKHILAISSWLFIVLIAGCCQYLNDCPTVTVGPSLPKSVIEAKTSIGGVVGPWMYAVVQGAAFPDGSNGYSCTPNSTGCYLSFQGATNSNGNYTISSNAIPGDWQIGIEPDQNCPQGAATQVIYLTPSTTYTPTLIVCNSIGSGSATASPATCTQTLNNSTGVMTSNCPSTISLTIRSDSLPTAHALNISDYSETGIQQYSFSGSASNTTTIVIPTPSVVGQSVLVIFDPQTDVPLGAALFTINQVIENPNPCGTKKSCNG